MNHKPSLVESLVRVLLRHARLVLGIALVFGLVAGTRTVKTYAALRSDLEELLPSSAPSVLALSKLRERLPGIRHLGVVVAVDEPSAAPAAYRFLDALAERVKSYPKDLVAEVRANGRAEREFAEKYALQLMDSADVRGLREAVEARRDWDVSRGMGLELDEEEGEGARPEIPIAELREKYEARYGKPRLGAEDRFISPDGKNIALLVRTATHATGQNADAELISRVQADIRALGFPQAFDPKLRLGFAGDVAARVEEARGLESDLTLSGLLVLLLVGGSVAAYYRSLRALPILGLPLALGAFAAFGLAALPPLSITYLNSNTAFLGSIVIGNGINSGIILLSRYAEEHRKGASSELAVERAVSETWRATLAASLAASAAYGSLIFTNFRGFNQFGWIGGIGLITCWIANYTVLPVLAAKFGGPLGGRAELKATSEPKSGLLGRLVLGHPRWVLAAVGILGVVSVAGIVQRSSDYIEYDMSKLRRRDSWESGERYWGKRLDAALGRYLTPTLILAESTQESEHIAARVRELQRKGEAGALIGSVRSASDLMPADRDKTLAEMQRLKDVLTPRLLSEVAPEQRKLVERALAPDALVPLEVSQLPGPLVLGLLERSGRIDRTVLVFPKLGSGTWDVSRLDAFSRDLRQAATLDGAARPVAGSLLLASDIARAMRADGPRATLLSLAAVLVICLMAFRTSRPGAARSRFFASESLQYSGAAVASLLVGVLLMLGFLALTGERLNFSNFVALPITFGVAADYSINVLKRYQSEDTGSLAGALTSTGGAVALCSATTVFGFGSLLLAQNQALFSFGVFAVAGELTCLATAVIGLPAALALWERRHRQPPSKGRAGRAHSRLGAATAIHR